MLLAVLAAHASPVRALVLRRAASQIRTSFGIDIATQSFSYNLLTLSAELRGVQLAAVDAPAQPFAAADALSLSFAPRTLLGDIEVKRLSITSPRIDIRRLADGTDNLPSVNRSPSNGEGFTLPRIDIDDLDVSIQYPSASAVIRGAALQIAGAAKGRLSGTVTAKQGMTMTAGDRTIDLDAAEATFDLDGERLELRRLTASRPGGALNASGDMVLRGDASTIDLTANASSDVQYLSQAPGSPEGRVEATARVTGSLSDPAIMFETRGPSLTWSDVAFSDVRARGRYRSRELTLESVTAGVAGGTIEAHGSIAPRDPRRSSRIEAQWTGIDAQLIPGFSHLGGLLSKSGTAIVDWRGSDTSAPPRVEVSATTGIAVSDTMIPIVVQGFGQGDRWEVKAAARDTHVAAVNATAGIELDSTRWQASPIDGRVEMRTADLPAAVRMAQGLGLPAGFDASSASGAIVVDATLAGTLEAVRSTGRIEGRSLTVAGLPRLDLDASFGLDARQQTSTGTFRLEASALESATFVPGDDFTLGGSVTGGGTWSGPFRDPIVDANLSGQDLTIRRGGTIFTVGAVTGDLAVAGGTMRVQARAPAIKTSVDFSARLASPYAFGGQAALDEYGIAALLGLTGLDTKGGSVRGTISSSIVFKGDLRDRSTTDISLIVAPIDATVLDVPIVMSRGLRAHAADGNVTIDDAALTVGAIAVGLRGSIGLDGAAGNITADVNGDLGPLAPWLKDLSGHDDLDLSGRINGRLDANASPAGVVVSGTVDGIVSSLSKGDRVLARDIAGAIVLTGERAELRKANGVVLGGALDAGGDVPLAWLNEWLPHGFQIASRDARPATMRGTASFTAPALFELLGRPPLEAISGNVDIAAELSASAPDLAAIAGDITLQRAEVNARELKYVQSEITRARLAKGALTIETLDWRGPGTQIVGSGHIGLIDGIDTNVRLDLNTELGIVGALLSGRATGRVDGNVEVHGGPGALRIETDATLRDASWLIPGQRLSFNDWSGHVRLAGPELSVTTLGGSLNGGNIRVDGRLAMEGGAAGGGLTIAARDILLDVPRGLHSQLGANLVWQRSAQQVQLRGEVEVTANRYSEPVTRILQLVNSLSSATRVAGASALPAWLAETTLDIGIAVTDPILIDNSVGTVELMPDLRLAGTIDSPALSGSVDVTDDGRITIGGRVYRLRDSQVRFAPADGLVPTLDAVGDTRIGEYDVTIRINGTPDRVETSFSSVPPLGERELQSLIVTGQTGEQSAQNRQSDDNFAAAAAATDILGFAGRFVGLDTVRIGAADLDLVSKDVSTAQHLTVAKSLGSSFELIFSDNLEDGSLTWVLVWKPTSVNEIRLSSVEDGTRAIEFRRSLVFGPGSPAGPNTGRRGDETRAIVEAVRITGAPGFSEGDVARPLELDAGNRFDVRRWIEDRHRLEEFYLNRGYHRVRIAAGRSEGADPSRVVLSYDIRRGPMTVIETSGDPLPGEIVDAMYDAWRGLPIAEVARTEFERIAREGLARRGYYRPVVRIDFSAETPDLARVTVDIRRGPQTKQLLIAWSGNRDVSNADLDALVAPHREESAMWLDAETLAWQVRQLYAGRGYLKAEVTVGEPASEDDRTTVPFTIEEGVLSRLASVRIDGVDPARSADAVSALGLAIGEPFAASAPVEAARRLKAFYTGLGYRRATVAHTQTTAADGAVSIAWTVQEGPLYRVKAVTVAGAETTSDGLVQKAITLAPGDTISQSALDTTRRNLYDIGSFRRIDFDFGDSAIQSAPGEAALPLTIRAEEPQRFQLKYGIQFSFDRSAGSGGGSAIGASVELRDRNFIGRAVQASLGAHWDTDLQIIGVLFSSPRMFGKRVRTNLYARDRREQEVLDSTTPLFEGAHLDDRRREVTIEQRWRPAAVWELVWGYSFSSRRFLITHADQQTNPGGLLAGPIVSVILDRRDSPFDATRGLFHSSSFQFGSQPLGSDLNYVRYLLRQSYYQPIRKITLAGSVRYGTIRNSSGTAPISIIDLFFNAGGTNTVRGYSEDSLSAITIGGFELGGTHLLVLNGELRFPLTKRFGAAAFVDAGNTFARANDLALGELALGAGLGLRIRTPLAPFRLDVAYPFSSVTGQRGVRVHFSIGQIF